MVGGPGFEPGASRSRTLGGLFYGAWFERFSIHAASSDIDVEAF
jgi:hypothetical protein